MNVYDFDGTIFIPALTDKKRYDLDFGLLSSNNRARIIKFYGSKKQNVNSCKLVVE